jgi:hypothetical protein
MSFWGSIAGAVIGGLFQAKAAKEQRKQAIADQDQQFVRMRDAAEKAGFNPLTALRLTGGQGFGGLPTFSKYAAFGNVAMGITDAFINKPIDKYNKEVRELELEQRRADLAIAKQTLGAISKGTAKTIAKGVPEARKNVLDGYALGTSANENLATMNGNVTTDTETTATQTRVRSDGSKYTGPAGEDLDEMLLNSAIYAGEQMYVAVQQLSKEGFKALNNKKQLNPNLPVISNKAPPLSKLQFGPNYADRLSLEGFAYNY